MAVNLGKEFSRNPNSGANRNRKTQQIPNAPSQQIGVANDPGVAGGPNLPSDFYGNGGVPGLLSTGDRLQDAGNQGIENSVRSQRALEAQALKSQLQAEELEIGLSLKHADEEFGRLSADLGKTTAPYSGEGMSPFDEYRDKSQKFAEKTIENFKKKGFSARSTDKLSKQMDSAIRTHTSAVGKSVKELRENEYAAFVGRSYKSSAERHPGDLSGTLAENADIFRDTRLLLGDTKALELYQASNEVAALQLYDEHFDEGRYAEAQAALDNPLAKTFISPETRRQKITEIRKARTRRFIDDEVTKKAREKASENIIEKNGKSYQLKRDVNGDIVATAIPGLPVGDKDLTKNTVETTNGSRVQIVEEADGSLTANPIKGFPVFDDFTKDTVKLKDGRVAQLTRDDDGTIKSRPIKGTESIPDAVSTFEGLVTSMENAGLTVDDDTKIGMGKALAGLSPEKIPEVTAKIDAAKLLLEDGTISFQSDKEKSNFFKSLIPKDALTGADKGKAEAEEDFAKANRLKELGFRDVFEVDASVTNSISNLVEDGLGSVSKGGVLTRVEGAEKLSPTLISMAEDNLAEGKARTIGQAVRMAFEQFEEDGGKLPKIISGASIVKSLKKAAARPSLEAQLENQEKRNTAI